MSPSPRPALSITLPPSVACPTRDAQLPQTPEGHEPHRSTMYPPPPPRPQAFKVRRRRTVLPEEVQVQEPEPEPEPVRSHVTDTVIPSIEMSEADSELSSPVFQPSPSSHGHGLLSPLPPIQRFITPPKTPAPRLQASLASLIESPANEWDLINDSRQFVRSGSVCSSFSDSSVSSCGSSAFSAPNNCASPDSEVTDPFLEDDTKSGDDKWVLSPNQHSSPLVKRRKTHRGSPWTQAMDDHLWYTFVKYLDDPCVTPFKMLPGSVAPLGVCTRVAGRARRTWPYYNRRITPSLDAEREGSPDTIRPTVSNRQPQWPRSDGATRRRLRGLCKRRTSLPSYYHRLVEARSPSPFSSSSGPEPSTEAPAPTTFSSRDMHVSLATATASSMQPDGPLARLSSDEVTPPRPQTSGMGSRTARPADWFARIPRSQAHQKSLSLQSGLNLNHSPEQPAGYLASPFEDVADREHLLHSMSTTKSLGRTAFNMDTKAPTLGAPVELSGAPTAPRSLKRRFKSDEEKPKRPAIQDVFGPSPAQEPVMVRNRGFTVGAVRASDTLAKLLPQGPCAPVDQEMTEAPAAVPPMPQFSELGSRSAPRRLAEPVPRLGSPFAEVPDARPYNTFPRLNYMPTAANPQPFQQRLRELAAQGAASVRQESRY